METFELNFSKEETAEDNTVNFIASTEEKNRNGYTITFDGWNLSEFMENPVMFFNHQSWNLPIARVVKLKKNKEKRQIEGTAEFANTTLGKEIKELVNGGFINTVSVGLEYSESTGKNNEIITKKTLREISFVNIPADKNAKIIRNAEELSSSILNSCLNGTCKKEQKMTNDENDSKIEKEVPNVVQLSQKEYEELKKTLKQEIKNELNSEETKETEYDLLKDLGLN